ncbi:MAG: hypothetical protein HZB66_03445 [Candidatus Aenigmarchaeota archaeon]|nr:hypothetical protein [Candidatus Aenigmarchaeota archaeon]
MVFEFFRKRAIYSLRKRYDRVREKADRMYPGQLRNAVLTTLDQVEPTLVVMEERDVNIIERGRMIKYVKAGIANAKDILKGKGMLPIQQPIRR